MTPPLITESIVEEAALSCLKELGYTLLFGPDIAPGELFAERDGYDEVILLGRLRSALAEINSNIPDEAREEAVRKVLRAEHPGLIENNRQFHRYLIDGVPVEYRGDDRIVSDQVRLIHFSDPGKNDWLAVNQFTVIEDRQNRRPDIVVFVNGLPLAVIELKNPVDENATVRESVRAKLRTLVKRILRKHGYPPDKQEKATQTVLEQAELLCKDWVA